MEHKFLNLYIMFPFTTEVVEVEWLEALTSSGEFLVLPNHAAMLSSISDGESIRYKIYNGETKSIKVAGAIMRLDGKDSIFLFC